MTVVTLSLQLGPPAEGQVRPNLYTFTEIAGPDALFSSVDGAPSINASGEVAFHAFLRIDPNRLIIHSGIFTGTGGPPTMIVGAVGSFGPFGVIPSINDAGALAFKGAVLGEADGIFIGDGGPVTIIARASTLAREAPSINDDGTVAFAMAVDFNTRDGIFTGSGGPITPIITTGPGSPFNAFSNPSINNARRVVLPHASLIRAPGS